MEFLSTLRYHLPPNTDVFAAPVNLRLLYYRTVAQALSAGYNERPIVRPPLPLELVTQILRLAEFMHAAPYHDTEMTVHASTSIMVYSPDMQIHKKAWFRTKPFNMRMITRTAQVRLQTLSHDQGWTTHPQEGSWSWFEIAVIRATRKADQEEDARVERVVKEWKSHHNEMAQKASKWYDGVELGPSHEIWATLKVGDVIEV